MAKENKEEKIILEREYTVPLRNKCANTPQYKRTPKAVKSLKEFLAKHMKVEERDTDKVKLDRYLNEELWFRGIRKPASKIKVKAKKYDSGIVRVELADIPEKVKFGMDRENRLSKKAEKEKPAEKPEEKAEKKETAEEKEIKEEKKESVEEMGKIEAEMQHKQEKHTKATVKEKPIIQRKALQR